MAGKVVDDATLGAVLGGMIAFDHAIQNQLTDSHLDSAIYWAKRYRSLYDQVQLHNRDLYVANVLDGVHGWHRDDVDRAIEHYESMKMGGRSE